LGFDLMSKSKARRGDRSRRLDDRYLFLEALLSARELLYLSYQGFSQKDNSVRSPSILLSELLEYCQQCFCLEGQQSLPVSETEEGLRQHLLTQHALQPFASKYFRPDTQHPAYQQHWLAVARRQYEAVEEQVFLAGSLSQAPLPEDQEAEVALDELIAFFSNPAKAFFNLRWQSRFTRFNSTYQDDEPFAFDALDKYKLNERLIGSDEHSSWQSRLRAEGKLPIANSGPILLEKIEKQSAVIRAKLAELGLDMRSGSEVKHEVNLPIDGLNIVAWIDALYGKNLILWRAGKLRAKDKLALYLNWLCLCAQPPSGGLQEAHFVGTDSAFSLPLIAADEATLRLEDFVKYWRMGAYQAVHFYPESAWKWLKTEYVTLTLQTFEGNSFVGGEGQEPHIQRLCPDLSQHFAAFTEVSEELMSPLFELGGGK